MKSGNNRFRKSDSSARCNSQSSLQLAVSEKRLGYDLGDEIKYLFVKFGKDPDKIILNIVKRVYGHELNYMDFIEFIERSPLIRRF